ncbi:hypothetical protein QFZ37_002950 [Chryseobacterium ginsenosidimutans]|nr:hypothetical protein [Chryseobacterium ginsenosidimutans]
MIAKFFIELKIFSFARAFHSAIESYVCHSDEGIIYNIIKRDSSLRFVLNDKPHYFHSLDCLKNRFKSIDELIGFFFLNIKRWKNPQHSLII